MSGLPDVLLLEACGLTVTDADALCVVSAWLVAVTVTVVVDETDGAVYIPVLEMLPAVAAQVTAVFVVLLTVAVNCFVAAEVTVAVDGVIDTETEFPDVAFNVQDAVATWLALSCTVSVAV